MAQLSITEDQHLKLGQILSKSWRWKVKGGSLIYIPNWQQLSFNDQTQQGIGASKVSITEKWQWRLRELLKKP